jgi:hypothetical protein
VEKKRQQAEQRQREIEAIKQAQMKARAKAQEEKYLEERRKEQEKKEAMKNRAAFFLQKEEENSKPQVPTRETPQGAPVKDIKSKFQN